MLFWGICKNPQGALKHFDDYGTELETHAGVTKVEWEQWIAELSDKDGAGG